MFYFGFVTPKRASLHEVTFSDVFCIKIDAAILVVGGQNEQSS